LIDDVVFESSTEPGQLDAPDSRRPPADERMLAGAPARPRTSATAPPEAAPGQPPRRPRSAKRASSAA
jgi:hypothetical protein